MHIKIFEKNKIFSVSEKKNLSVFKIKIFDHTGCIESLFIGNSKIKNGDLLKIFSYKFLFYRGKKFLFIRKYKIINFFLSQRVLKIKKDVNFSQIIHRRQT
jgi:hypothetical protein